MERSPIRPPVSPPLVERGLPALENRRLPVLADRPRVLHPWPELRLGELAVLLLQANAVGVARLEVSDQHLTRDLVLASLRNVEVQLQERVRVGSKTAGMPSSSSSSMSS